MQNSHPLRIFVGRGGRESALTFKLSQSPLAEEIFVAPGNGGTAKGRISKASNLDGQFEEDFDGLVKYATELRINFVVPEAAQLEGSKAFSKDFMARYGIPTAEYRNFTNFKAAEKYVNSISHKVVIKASGLAARKGVLLPETKDEAIAALKEMILDPKFDDAGDEVVVEELLEGDEMSILTFSDGVTFKSMFPAQDHKRVFDGDKGLNTGGMGGYAPTKITPASLLQKIDEKILGPTFEGLGTEGTPFIGMLFTGIMVTKSGPKTLEYNARFGDLETQTLIPLLESDVAEIMVACTEKRLHKTEVVMEDKSCAAVVLCAGGYPEKYRRGDKITFKSVDPALHRFINYFRAGTALKVSGALVTDGGRVISVSSTGDNLEQAVKRAYEGVALVDFDNMHYRKDIAYRAFK